MFSEAELKILKIIGRRKITIAKIVRKFYDHEKLPYGANNSIGGTIRRINTKCEYHRLPWFLNGMGAGRAGRTVWKDKL